MSYLTSTKGSTNRLLDVLIDVMGVKNDAGLARRIGFSPQKISRMRVGNLPAGASFLINAHEESGIPIAELKMFAGLKYNGANNAN